jgi:group I intron endonuclease
LVAVVYRWRNLETGDVYIGSTSNRDRREREHRSQLARRPPSKSLHPCKPFRLAWERYGSDAFVFEVLETIASSGDKLLLRDELAVAEQRHLLQVSPSRRYNVALFAWVPPSRLGCKVSPEGRKRISEAHKGQTISPEHLAKLVAAKIGHVVSSETRAKISQAQKGKIIPPAQVAKAAAARRGWVPSAEWREKFRVIHTGRKRPPEVGRKISAKKLGHEVSPETRAKISASKTGVRQTPEQRKRNSESKIGKPKPWLRGRKHTEAHRQLNAQRLRELWADPEWRSAQMAKMRGARARKRSNQLELPL